ncbi:hypothetical protein CRM22_002805 [Opisthorchis felineus]|uniref:SCP domain-containing protein n=1 Tax=Opisthorchis felineus TaxID=147828 RepID=A0A4S2M499_OPIFE|nr:hypothetical protein CRM22_002805 [Opisthorchis felineus]
MPPSLIPLNWTVTRMQSHEQPRQLTYHHGGPPPTSSYYSSQQERSYRGIEQSENEPIGKTRFFNAEHNRWSTVHYYAHFYTAKQFLDKHNFYRRRLLHGTEPDGFRAKEMPDLVWDQKLYEDAKRHAQICIFEHNPEDEVYGENLALSYGKIADPVESWYEGRKTSGHYDQVVCATTRRVGCIMIFCPKLPIPDQNETISNAFYSVCRYMPPKYVEHEPYEKI